MKHRLYKNRFPFLLILILISGTMVFICTNLDTAFAQGDAPRTFCKMDGNNISTNVYNFGTIGHGKENANESWWWPRNSRNRYGNEFGFILAAEVPNETSENDPDDYFYVVTHGMENKEGWSPLPGWCTKPSQAEAQQGFLATYNRPNTWGEKFPLNSLGELSWPGQFAPGKNVADFECFYKMDDRSHAIYYYSAFPDAIPPRGGIGVEVTVRGYQFSPKILADVIFFQYEMKNVSPKNLEKLVVAIMGDPQLGGEADLHDDSVGTAENDIVIYWDADDVTTSFSGNIGYMGFSFLETPKDANGAMLNLTSLSAVRSNELDPDHTTEMWKALMPGHYEMTQDTDNLLLMGSGYFKLPADSTQKLTFVSGFAMTKEQLLENMLIGNKVYESDFIYIKAPDTPKVSAIAGDGFVDIKWDTKAELSEDPLWGKDFEGYLVYRSMDAFLSDTLLLGQFDKADGIKDYHEVPIEGTNKLFYLGDDTGLQHKFTDANVINGLTYYYAVTAYDTGSVKGGIAPRECAKILGSNMVKVTPRSDPALSMDDIAVVPNPYIASSLFDSPPQPNALGTFSGKRVIFINLPSECTIRIYTITGELVKKISHAAQSGNEPWDLLNYDGLKVASGTYIYHIEAPGFGEKIGRIYIIK